MNPSAPSFTSCWATDTKLVSARPTSWTPDTWRPAFWMSFTYTAARDRAEAIDTTTMPTCCRPRVRWKYRQAGTLPPSRSVGSSGLGEKMFFELRALSATATWMTGTSVPCTASAVPLSTIDAPPTSPKAWPASRVASERFWPLSVRSSPVASRSLRPQMPPVLFT